MKKVIIATLLSLAFLSGCDDTKNDATTDTTTGNIAAKAETLSSQNEVDIRADLMALNTVVNTSNSKAVELAKQLVAAGQAGDASEVEKILLKSKELLESTNSSLLSLTLKSSEVQKIRTDIYQGNMLATKFYDLYLKKNKSDEENKEMVTMQKQMIALQQSVGPKLDQLNSQYKVQ